MSDPFQSTSLVVQKQTFILHPFKAIYWADEEVLILADLHLGKAQHFRKHGLAVPTGLSQSNFDRLKQLIDEFAPVEVLILGDLFHSEHNVIWDLFCAFINQFPTIKFSLVPGNHDILSLERYQNSPLHMLELIEERGPFLFSHHPLGEVPGRLYNIYGHIHPGIKMVGRALQSLRLPCFFFGDQKAILPAFGSFTGLYTIQPKQSDRVFALAENDIIRIQ